MLEGVLLKVFNAMFSKVNGGLEQAFLNYTACLKQHNQVLAIIHPDAEIRSSCEQEHLALVHNYNRYDFLAVRRLAKLIQQEKPDCIITHGYRTAYLFSKTKAGVPIIAVSHVKGHSNFGTDAIIALTETMRDDIIKDNHAPETVFVVPNMLEVPDNLQYKPPKDTDLPVIGVAARFAHIKGVDIFIKALALLKRRKVRFLAKIAGDGEDRGQLSALIREHDLEDSLTLLGWVTDTQSFYDSLDIFCLPSREEAFGLVVIEAMMHSLPMVLTKTTGAEAIIADTGAALLVPIENPISLADALEKIITDKLLARRLSMAAVARAKDYSLPTLAEVLQSVLNTVTARHPNV